MAENKKQYKISNYQVNTIVDIFRVNWRLFFVDILIWISTAFAIWFYRTLSCKFIVFDYVVLLLVMMCLWIFISWLAGRYRKNRSRDSFLRSVLNLLIITSVYALCATYYVINNTNMAGDVFFWAVMFVCLSALIFDFLRFAYKYAQYINEVPRTYDNNREPKSLVVKPERLNSVDYDNLESLITGEVGKEGLELIKSNADISVSTTKVLCTNSLFNVEALREYRFDTIINLCPVNEIKGVNKMFCAVNSKIPDNGKFICLFVPQEFIKKEILSRYPRIINYVIYVAYFVYRRILPRMMFSSRIYFDLTKGKKRVFSETEILGRLYYCGFSVDNVLEYGRHKIVVAHRTKQPEPQIPRKWYGAMISLPRVGKNYNIITVYKFRTMHPYAEYIQQYVYEKRGLQKGGKFADDQRVTTIGKFLRTCWLDELPMLINVFKGDMKLVGVRPLSRQYFSLYPEKLQQLRTRFKPGLIPPFYVDMPKTTNEIFESEEKYLLQYKKHPQLTDIKYLFLVFRNIILCGERSN